MKYLFIINPISGDQDKKPFLELLNSYADQYNLSIEIFTTTGEDDIAGIQKRVGQFDPDRVAAVGGDGTVHMVAEALHGREIPVGIIPMGSADGIAKELCIPTECSLALETFLLSRHCMDLDMIGINDRFFCLHFADIGINAQLVEDFSKDGNRGMVTYARYFLEEVPNRKLLEGELFLDGEAKEIKVYMVAFANARRVGTGVLLNPAGNISDGRFEVVCINDVTLGSLVQAGLSTLKEVDYGEVVEVVSCKRARLVLKEPTTLQVDGEVKGEVKEINAEILPAAISIITKRTTETE